MVARIGDVEIPRSIDGDTARLVQSRARRRTAIAREAGLAIPGDRRDHAVRRHFANPVVERVGDEEVPAGVDGDPDRGTQ